MRVLIIEDHRDLAANIGEFLGMHGHVVDYAGDGLSGLHLATANRYDVAVLDLGLPGLDGLSLCRRLRQQARSTLPILMLSGRAAEADALQGFDAGADDYLNKPVSLAVLHAHLQAIHRRANGCHPSLLQVADLSFDPSTLICMRAGRRIELSRAGTRLLESLMKASPKVVTREEAEMTIWGDDPSDCDSALRTHIYALRRAIDTEPEPKLLHTVHGIGYRMALEGVQ